MSDVSKGLPMREDYTAPSSVQLKNWKKLTLEKYRRQSRTFLAEGRKIVGELLGSNWPVKGLLVCGGGVGQNHVDELEIPDGVPLYRLTERQWKELSQDKSAEGVMAVAGWPELPFAGARSPEAVLAGFPEGGNGPLLLLYQINNPNNLGALLRTARWFGFTAVILSKNSCEAANPKVVRTSMGAIFHLRVVEGADLEEVIAGMAGRLAIIGSDVRAGVAPHPCKHTTALLLGSESHGLPESLLALTAETWKIPGAGGGESLSLPQAGAIMMYECVRKIAD